MKNHYRAIFISDLHMGMSGSKTRELENFLHKSKSDQIYLVGDFFDFWHFRTHKGWSQECNVLLKRIFKLIEKGTTVTVLVGNHDAILYLFEGFSFGNVTLVGDTTHTTANGKKFLVIHGDRFDTIVGRNHFVSLVMNSFYDLIMCCSWFRPFMLGFKNILDVVIKKFSNFEVAATKYAQEHKCDGIICGHTHNPEIKQVNGGLYANCGDLVEHCTVLVEENDGNLKLLDISCGQNV